MMLGTDLSKSYKGSVALMNTSLEVAPGSFTMLLGRNGSGKSTLLNILALSLPPNSGTVKVDELTGRDARAAIGYAPQEIALFEELSVEENLRCWCRLPSGQAKDHIRNITDLLGLNDERRKLLYKLSGGQKRRVNLAAALMGSPRYLLLDEPLAGVDEESERRILDLLSDYVKKGCGLLISGHQPRLFRELADFALVLERGKTVFQGSADEYFSSLKEREL